MKPTGPEFVPEWDVARDKDGIAITITEEQLHAIWRAIQVVESVRDESRRLFAAKGIDSHYASGRESMWENPAVNLYKSRLLGRMLLDGRPPTRTCPPHNMGAPDWALLPGGDPFDPDRQDFGGIVISCSRCKVQGVLPYLDAKRDRVGILSIEGWSSPPLLCPECSPKAAQSDQATKGANAPVEQRDIGPGPTQDRSSPEE